MYLKINVKQGGTSTQIFVQAEEDEEPWGQFSKVRIAHNGISESIQGTNYPITNYANDYFVTFNSHVPFKQFCENFAVSEYNFPNKYHMLHHNCADAAHYALTLAGIVIRLNRIKSMYIVPSTILRVPSPILSPLDLFNECKALKLKDPQTPKLQSDIDTASWRLTHWSQDHPKKQCVEKIVSAVKNNVCTNQHHADLYLKVLLDTMHTKSSEEKTRYANFAQFFKHRGLSKQVKSCQQFLHGLAILVLLQLLRQVIYSNQHKEFFDLSSALLVAFCICLRYSNSTPSGIEKITDTPLSEAMLEFVKEGQPDKCLLK